jgi:hypothetical protein
MNDNVFYFTGYGSYKYFLEVFDLRTIILVNSEEDLEYFKKVLRKYFLRFGLCQDYAKANI